MLYNTFLCSNLDFSISTIRSCDPTIGRGVDINGKYVLPGTLRDPAQSQGYICTFDSCNALGRRLIDGEFVVIFGILIIILTGITFCFKLSNILLSLACISRSLGHSLSKGWLLYTITNGTYPEVWYRKFLSNTGR